MSVSDNSTAQPPKESRRAKWARIRNRYESGEMSQRELAALEQVSPSTLMQRAMREKWTQRKRANKQLISQTVAQLEAQTDAKIRQITRDELGPFIEAHKRKITKRGVRIANTGLSRIESLWKSKPSTEAKHEADGARAAETFLRMARTSLGMDDGKQPGAGLNLNILTGQAAIQVVSPNESK